MKISTWQGGGDEYNLKLTLIRLVRLEWNVTHSPLLAMCSFLKFHQSVKAFRECVNSVNI